MPRSKSNKNILKQLLPTDDLFLGEELKIYRTLVDLYTSDFSKDELSGVDMDDILSLATNRVMELRLIKASKSDINKQIKASTSIERLRKQSEKIKEGLSLRRKDRIANSGLDQGITILDLAASLDSDDKKVLEAKSTALEVELKAARSEMKKHTGNRYDTR